MTAAPWVARAFAAALLLTLAAAAGVLGRSESVAPVWGRLAAAAVCLAAAAGTARAAARLPRDGALARAFALAAVGAAAVGLSGALGRAPWVGHLWARDDPARYVLAALLVVTWWSLALCLHRARLAGAEARFAAGLRDVLGRPPVSRESLYKWLDADAGPDEGEALRRRARVLAVNAAGPDDAAWLMAEEAAVDAGRLQAAYGPLRALVWSLPALGFIGTAAAMAASIAGVGQAVDPAAGPDQLPLLTRVVPHLADAFGITLVALAAAVGCHFLLSLTFAAEERALLDGAGRVLEILAHLRAARAPGGAADPTANLLTELWTLQRRVEQVGGQLGRLLDGRGYADTLSTFLYAIVTELRVLGGRGPVANGSPAANGPDPAADLLRDIRDHLKAAFPAPAAGAAGGTP